MSDIKINGLADSFTPIDSSSWICNEGAGYLSSYNYTDAELCGTPNFLLADNGTTVTCDDAAVGESGEVNGITFTKIGSVSDLVFAGGTVDATVACTSGITDMAQWFDSGTYGYTANWNKDLSHWDTSDVTSMKMLFQDAINFNGDISQWNTSKLKNMYSMFFGATSYNGDMNNWDTSNVIDMRSIFNSASAFNGDISNWDVSGLISTNGMFTLASSFNRDISKWDVSNVMDASYMFFYSENFDQDISNWNTSSMTDMSGIFSGATNFSQDISTWCVTNIASEPTDFDTSSGFEGNTAIQPQWGGACPP